LRVDAFRAGDSLAVQQQTRHGGAVLKIHAGRGAGRQRGGKQMHVARLVGGREVAADDVLAGVRRAGSMRITSSALTVLRGQPSSRSSAAPACDLSNSCSSV
jgi:hypothetical protein